MSLYKMFLLMLLLFERLVFAESPRQKHHVALQRSASSISGVPVGIKKRGFFHKAYALNQFKFTDKGEPCRFYK